MLSAEDEAEHRAGEGDELGGEAGQPFSVAVAVK